MEVFLYVFIAFLCVAVVTLYLLIQDGNDRMDRLRREFEELRDTRWHDP